MKFDGKEYVIERGAVRQLGGAFEPNFPTKAQVTMLDVISDVHSRTHQALVAYCADGTCYIKRPGTGFSKKI